MGKYHAFEHINPLDDPSSLAPDAAVFFEPLTLAAARFTHHRSDSKSKSRADHVLSETLKQVERCLAQKNRELRDEDPDHESPATWNAGGYLIDWFQDRDDDGIVFTKRLKSGVMIGDAELLSALALVQIDRAVGAIEDNRALDVARFCLDLADLIRELDYHEVQLEDQRRVSDAAKRRARLKHAHRDAVKKAITDAYTISASSWPSVLQAAKALTPKARELAEGLGWRLSVERAEKTVYDWLREVKRER